MRSIWGFRIPDSRFRIPGSFPFGNLESRILNPLLVAAEGRVRISPCEHLWRFPIQYSTFKMEMIPES